MQSPVTIQAIMGTRNDPVAARRLYTFVVQYYRLYPVAESEYADRHHILPRCLGGNDEPENLVRLPALAHFDAHMLLAYAYRESADVIVKLQGAVRVLLGRHAPTFAQIESAPDEMRLRYHAARQLGDDRFEANKRIYLDLIKEGKHRPHATTYLGQMLNSYTNPSGVSFRKGFREGLVQAGAVLWFLETRFADYKRQVFELVARREPRPEPNTALGNFVGVYLMPNHERFRPDFYKAFMEAGGGYWFPETKYPENREKLLQMAREQQRRPSHKTYIGVMLRNYTDPSTVSFRPGLKEELYEAGADWFTDFRYNDNKSKLLDMIANGEARPHWKTYLGKALNSYISKGDKYRHGLKEELIEAGGDYWFTNPRGKIQQPRPKEDLHGPLFQ